MSVRIAFGVALTLVVTLLGVPAVDAALGRRSALSWLKGLFVGSRLAGWCACYVLFGGLTGYSDLVLYYYPEAALATGGQVPYLHFPTSYGPLFPFVAGALLPLWRDRAAVAIIMVAFEISAVLVFVSLALRVGNQHRLAVARTLFVYMANPAALYWSGMMAYNSSVILFFWVLAILLLLRGRYGLSTASLVAAVIAGKFLGVLAAPVWLATPRRRNVVIAVLGVLCIGVGIGADRYGVDVLLPIRREGSRSTAGNIWFLMSALLPDSKQGVLRYGPFAALAMSAVGLAAWLASRWKESPTLEQLCGGIACAGWTFMVLSKKTYPHYAPMFLLFSVFAVCRLRPFGVWRVVWLAVVGAIGIVEPGVWNALGQPQSLTLGWNPGVTSAHVLLAVMDLVLVASAALLAVMSARIAGGRAAPAQ